MFITIIKLAVAELLSVVLVRWFLLSNFVNYLNKIINTNFVSLRKEHSRPSTSFFQKYHQYGDTFLLKRRSQNFLHLTKFGQTNT